jgi:hypothetical protein
MDRTLKLRAYSDGEKNKAPQSKQEKERNIALELEKKSLLLEEEKNKSLDLLKTIVQLRESLKQEQAKSVELDSKLTKLNTVEESQLARKNTQLEEERSKSIEYTKTIEQLKENVTQLEAKLAKLNSVEENELAKKNVQLEEERSKALEYVKLIDQLRENIKQEQAKSEEMVSKFDELLAKTKSSAQLETQVKELKDVLGTISRIASSGKLDGNA